MKKIILIATGGTIAGKKRANGYRAGVLGVESLVANLGLEKIAKVTCEQLFNVGSQDMDDARLLKLAKFTQNALLDYDGAVILHGTDTMEESAYFLNLSVKSPKSVVFTGSMRTGDDLLSDGAQNITDALHVAVCEQSLGQGVLVVMNGEIHAAREVAKINTSSLGAFASPNSGKIGSICNEKVKFYMKSLRIHMQNSRFCIDEMPHLEHVEIFYAYQSARLPKFEPSLRGLIVAGMGDGNVSNDVFCGLKILANNGVIVALSSRTGSGGISGAESGDFCVTCDNLNPQKARILLSTALNFTQNRAQIQEIFNSY